MANIPLVDKKDIKHKINLDLNVMDLYNIRDITSSEKGEIYNPQQKIALSIQKLADLTSRHLNDIYNQLNIEKINANKTNLTREIQEPTVDIKERTGSLNIIKSSTGEYKLEIITEEGKCISAPGTFNFKLKEE
jgi:hypothetical protein